MKMDIIDKFVTLDHQEFIDYLKTIDNQYNALMYLYHLIIPDTSKIFKLNGFPSVNDKTSTFIFKQMIDFDKIHHKNVLPGGLWMNNGFSTDNTLPDGIIYYDMSKLVYKGDNKFMSIYFDIRMLHYGFKSVQFIRKANKKAFHNVTNSSWQRLKTLLVKMNYEKSPNQYTRFYK